MSKRERRKARRAETAGMIKRAIAAKLRESLEDNPEQFAKLTELGLIDEDAISRLPEDLDFAGVIRQFRDRVAEMAAEEPSVMTKLDVRPLDVLSPGTDEKAPADLARVPRTVVFSDLEGFTTFTSARGDLEAGALLRDHYDTVDAVVRSRGGTIVKTLGDGHMLSFREPAAAVMTCVDLVGASPAPLRLRAGGHLGDVVRTEKDLFGHVVNVAARVTGLADGGRSIVTVELRDAAGKLPRIEYAASRSETVSGLDEPIDVCEVLAN